MSETFFGYRFTGVVEEDPAYTHDGPTQLKNNYSIMKYVTDNVVEYPEIRIVDGGDLTVLHVIRQRLLFPLPDGLEVPPIWDVSINWFVPCELERK